MAGQPVRVKPVVGLFVRKDVAEVLHAYLMSRPGDETFDLVVALRNSKPLTREPK